MSQNNPAIYNTEDPTLPRPANTTVQTDFGTSLSNAVRENPASAALIGMGVAWLFFGGSKTSLFGRKPHREDDVRRYRERDDYRDDYELRFRAPSSFDRDVDRYGGAGRGGSTVRDAVGAVGSGARQFGSGIADGASTVSSAASQGYETVASYATDAASYIGSSAYDASRASSRIVRSQAGQVQQTVGEFFEHQPLALGVLGLALGAGIATLLPTTDIEREYLGETSDSVKEQARALAGEKLDQAKDLATSALKEVSREAEAQGLTKASLQDAAETLKERAASVASATRSSIKDEAGNLS